MILRFGLILIASIVCVMPQIAQAQLTPGVVFWKSQTALDVDRATDFDGSNETGEERLKNWDTEGSGAGLGLSYQFPQFIKVFGEIGLAQSTVRVEDVTDPDRDVSTMAFDDAVYLSLGARPGGSIPNSRMFWSAGVMFTLINSEFDEDVNTTWDYEEKIFSLDGRLGYVWEPIGVYGGLQFANYNSDLEETDRTNPIGQQMRRTELERDGQIDLLIGAQANGDRLTGSVQLGFVGSTSAKATLALRF